MTDRRADVQEFLDAVRPGFAASRMDPQTARCVHETLVLLDGAVGATRTGTRRFAACASLPEAVHAAKALSTVLARIAAAFETIERSLGWSQRNDVPTRAPT